MAVSEKTKTVSNKIEQNKTQYNLDKQTVKISVLSSGNAGKYEFLTDLRCFTMKILDGKSFE